MKKLVLRITLPLICCIVLGNAPCAEAQEPGPSGPQAAAIFAILIAVPVGIGFGVYYALHAPHRIEGCTVDQGEGLQLTAANGKRYLLAGNTAAIKAGERVRLSGKTRNDRAKGRIFSVKKVAQDFGACNPATPLP
jgi:hypothetical protein